jgi:ABC-type ATPase with predicted acetyltransferase domain
VKRPSARALRTGAQFGLCLGAPAGAHGLRAQRAGVLACALAREWASISQAGGRGQVVLITGPSGAGKSTLMRALAREVRRAGCVVRAVRLRARVREARVVDLSRAPRRVWLAHLASLGLGEPALWLQTPAQLSEGQRWRLQLALASLPARGRSGARGRVLVADEFGATLDRCCAQGVARALSRVLSRAAGQAPHAHGGALLATCHEDLHQALAPALHVRLSLAGQAHIERRAPLARAS